MPTPPDVPPGLHPTSAAQPGPTAEPPVPPPLLQRPPPGSGVAPLGPADAARLQAFFDANPAYFLAVAGRAAEASEAQAVIDERPPAEMGWTGRWLLGYTVAPGAGPAAATADGAPPLWAMVELVRDLLAPGVWHIGLLIVATERHGQGDAQRLMQALLRAIARAGGRWLRLGVVVGNARAERFWRSQGFVELRQRDSDVGGSLQTVRVMARPVAEPASEWPADYLAAVPRDRPEPDRPAAAAG